MKDIVFFQMFRVSSLKDIRRIFINPHFWIIIFITIVLVFIYQAWPWRYWRFTEGIWQWFPWLSPLFNLALVEIQYHIIGVLFFIPILYAIIILPWQGSLIISLISLGVVVSITTRFWNLNLLSNVFIFMLPFLIYFIINFERRWHNRERMIFTERETERKIYISKILDSQENERKHVAQELHDDTIQTLLVIANRTQSLITSLPSGDSNIVSNAEWIRDSTLQAIEDIRRISLDLTPSVLDNLGLIPALRWMVDRLDNESNINSRFIMTGTLRKLIPQTEVAVFRIVQEALNNVKRHSKANTVVVNLKFTAKYLTIIIEDDGIGFSPPKRFNGLATSGKLGLLGIKERTNYLNGELKIHTRLGEGASLFIRVKC